MVQLLPEAAIEVFRLAKGRSEAENVKGMTDFAAVPPAPVSADQSRPPIDPSQPVPAQYDQICEGCGYSLIGLMTDRCPECGERFDPDALPLARVPWLFRRSLGTFTAYFRTICLTMLMVFLCGTGITIAVMTALRVQFGSWNWLSNRELIQVVWTTVASM